MSDLMSESGKKWLVRGGTAGVILLIIAIVLPVFQKVREGSHRTCASQLKQLGLALVQYSQDNDEKMPNVFSPDSSSTWRTALLPFTGSRDVFYCIEREEKRSKDEKNKAGSDGFPQDFAANYTGNYSRSKSDKGNGAFAGPGSEPLTLADFDSPATTITLTEVSGNNRPDFNLDEPVHFGPAAKRFWAGHNGFSRYLFMDGHVKQLHPLATLQVDGDKVRNLWYRDNTKTLSANGTAVLKDTEARFPQ